MGLRTFFAPALLVVGLAGCATPDVVEVSEVGDDRLTCGDLHREIAEADRFEREARDDRGVTGKNVAAAMLFWPALLATYSNTEDAIDAAEERQRRLQDIAHRKGC